MLNEQLERLIRGALAEDIGPGDITTELLVPKGQTAEAFAVARKPLVVSGAEVFREVFRILDPEVKCELLLRDSDTAAEGQRVIRLYGPAASILTGERVALNFLGRLSGVATLTRLFADRLSGLQTKLLDTRKTTPGLRALEKMAVVHGGGVNHRLALFDGVLIKDNHIAAAGGVANALRLARPAFRHKIEIEVDTLEGLMEAMEGGADMVLLDNMDPLALREAVRRAEYFWRPGARLTLLEASGGVTLESVREAALSGVDFISVGALTHSAPSADLGLDFA
jgi:nicotinate-nucleotide pyrophosphorylase (carboxylating)